MKRLANSASWTAGWLFLLVGTAVMVGGSATWASQFLARVSGAPSPSWLTLLGFYALALLCFGMGLIAHVVAATRLHALRRARLQHRT